MNVLIPLEGMNESDFKKLEHPVNVLYFYCDALWRVKAIQEFSCAVQTGFFYVIK